MASAQCKTGSALPAADRRRCGLTLRYCSADVRAEMEWNQKGVWVAGEDAAAQAALDKRAKGLAAQERAELLETNALLVIDLNK